MSTTKYHPVDYNTFKFNVPYRCVTITADKVLRPDKKTIQLIAANLIADVAESYYDMIVLDGEPAESGSREGIMDVYEGLVETALEVLGDHIHDLREGIVDYLKNIKVSTPVTAMMFDDDGDLTGFNMAINIQELPKQAAVVDTSTKEVAVAA